MTYSENLFKFNNSGQLQLFHKDDWINIRVTRCFPWTKPREFLSFHDDEGTEFLFVGDIDDLTARDSKMIAEYLDRTQFTIKVTGINSIEEDVELRRYDVRTASGNRVFYTSLEDWPERKGDGRFVIKDLYGDFYEIPELSRLERSERKVLSYLVE
jgi:hypothetical protein